MGGDLQKRQRFCLSQKALSRGRKILVNTLLLIFSTLAALSIILTAVVLFYHNGITKLRWPVGAHRYSEGAGFEMTPGFSAKMLGSSFYVKTHELGFRIPEFQDSKSVITGGVIAIGCSYTFGDEVDAEKTFTWQIAARLGLPAYNYGVCSSSYTSSILQLQ